MTSCGDLEKFFPRKMLKILQVFLRFFVKKTFQSLAICHFKHLKLKRYGYRITIMESRLRDAFQPAYLEVIDESDKHIGHAGHQGGGRHFAVVIASDHFKSMSRIQAHREIYALFSDMIPDRIHALRIIIKN